MYEFKTYFYVIQVNATSRSLQAAGVSEFHAFTHVWKGFVLVNDVSRF